MSIALSYGFVKLRAPDLYFKIQAAIQLCYDLLGPLIWFFICVSDSHSWQLACLADDELRTKEPLSNEPSKGSQNCNLFGLNNFWRFQAGLT